MPVPIPHPAIDAPPDVGVDLRCWGKAGSGKDWHPLTCHSLDVAAVAATLLRAWPRLADRLARTLRLTEEQTRSWVCFWLALHDLGKFAESFQAQRPDLFRALRGREPDAGKPYTVRHDSLGWLFWLDVLRPCVVEHAWFGADTEDLADGLDAWVRASVGHHGQPPEAGGNWQMHFHPQEDRAAAMAYVVAMRRLFLDDALVAAIAGQDPRAFLAASQGLSWWIAGLAVLADWLGSNTDFFPYLDLTGQPAPTLADYWASAQERAAAAVAASGVVPPAATAEMPFWRLFAGLDTPSPLQRWAADVPLAPGPQVHCLEDVTGAGKTEAALMLTHRLLAAGVADGFYVALPTMATANAMYARVAGVHARLFDGPASLVHATGQSRLFDAFAASIVEDLAAAVLPRTQAEGDPAQRDETASARCAGWLADHRKRALLAPAGVGTIDQALLAVLQSKHQSLRLLGLQRKVLVVDEVHACDDYMLGVLRVLLRAHARGGGSAVLLSATLPLKARQALFGAFAEGLQQPAPQAQDDRYPLASSWPSPAAGRDQVHQTAIATRPDVRRRVSVSLQEEPAAVPALIRRALAAGQCVCWVRNTVADAIDAFDLFAAELPAKCLALFHARFALHDRLATEHQVLQRFGKDSGPAQRAGRLLIATQVVEQSLDVDFDVLVSDLAPIDRLVQRAGRLRRHRRTADGTPLPDAGTADARGEPVLHVLCPPWTEDPAAGWFKAAFPKAASVYANHAQLWLTMQALRQGHFTMPDDARGLIEGVFGGTADAPPGLQPNALACEGQAWASLSQAQMNAIRLDQGYERDGIDWWSDAMTPSRLGDATSTVMLARWDGSRLRPWIDRPHGWAYSSLRMAESAIAAEAGGHDDQLDAAVQQLRDAYPTLLRWAVLLPLRETPDGWAGDALAPCNRRRTWLYDPRRGLLAQTSPTAGLPGIDDRPEDPEA